MVNLERQYDRLYSLQGEWRIAEDDLHYAVENGLLRVCVWLPMRYMERGVIRDGGFIYERHEHNEGFVGIRSKEFHQIRSTGCAKLRIFRSIQSEGYILRLADEPPQPSLSVRLRDLVVLKSDRSQFETTYGISQKTINSVVKAEFVAAADYRHLVLRDVEYQLGHVQAAIIQQLHDAAGSRNPWVHGKILLNAANSRASTIRDVFKSKRTWREIIISDGRGYYRLNIFGSGSPRADHMDPPYNNRTPASDRSPS